MDFTYQGFTAFLRRAVADPDSMGTLAGVSATPSNYFVTKNDSWLASFIANIPNAAQKAALAGTSGIPGSGDKYVTDADSRMTNARTPTAHAASHAAAQSDAITPAAIGARASATAIVEADLGLTDLTTANFTSTVHGFVPKSGGGTANFLRADGTFAVPTAVLPGLIQTALATTAATQTVTAAYGVVIPRQYTINSGQALVIGSGARVRIL